jgi:aryl-alcohol dehydrogenase-like predicted oxidoreductase
MISKTLGTAQLVRSYGAVSRRPSIQSELAAIKLLKLAEEKGFRAVDTAPVYGPAESVIGRAGISLEVHTKLNPSESVASSIENSRRLLNRDLLDLVYIHDSSVITDPNNRVVASLAELVGTKVKKIGVSVYDVSEFRAADADPRIDVIQVPFNIFDQRSASFRLNTSGWPPKQVVARSIFLQGLLLLSPTDYPKQHHGLLPHGTHLATVAEKHGLSLLELAIGFAKQNSLFSELIFGIDSSPDLLEISDVFDRIFLGEDVMRDLRSVKCVNSLLVDPRKWT